MADIIEAVKIAAINAVKAGKPVEISFGTVTSTTPLIIDKEQKIQLRDPQLTLTRNVTDYEIEMSISHYTENEGQHTHGYFDSDTGQGSSGSATRSTDATTHRHAYAGRKMFTVHNSLVIGDKVLLLRVQGGQKYVVWDRVMT